MPDSPLGVEAVGIPPAACRRASGSRWGGAAAREVAAEKWGPWLPVQVAISRCVPDGSRRVGLSPGPEDGREGGADVGRSGSVRNGREQLAQQVWRQEVRVPATQAWFAEGPSTLRTAEGGHLMSVALKALGASWGLSLTAYVLLRSHLVIPSRGVFRGLCVEWGAQGFSLEHERLA